MLPECRSDEYLYTIPIFEVGTDNLDNFVEELRKFHEGFSECFARSEPRGNFYDYMVGQLSHLERKTIEPIAVNVNGINSVR